MKQVLIAILSLSSHAAFSCDCTIVPFPPSCAKECMGKLLAKAGYIQLRESLGLSSSTSRKIFHFPEKEKITSIDAYSKVLDGQEMTEVKEKLSKIDSRTIASIVNDSGMRQTARPH
jgi:hypothetical protein